MKTNSRAAPAAPSLHTDAHDTAPSWAHVSGWAQLSGTRRTVSCVLTCRNQAPTLATLLPFLSDTLTECGYPWELIVVDIASVDQTPALLAGWAELPGFQSLSLHPGAAASNAFALGLYRARGDAVILLDAALEHNPALIPRMILKWEDQARVVFAQRDQGSGASRLVSWDDTDLQRQAAGRDFPFPREATALGLLDRRVLTELMRGT